MPKTAPDPSPGPTVTGLLTPPQPVPPVRKRKTDRRARTAGCFMLISGSDPPAYACPLHPHSHL
jgi:hypothetical protein